MNTTITASDLRDLLFHLENEGTTVRDLRRALYWLEPDQPIDVPQVRKMLHPDARWALWAPKDPPLAPVDWRCSACPRVATWESTDPISCTLYCDKHRPTDTQVAPFSGPSS